MPKPTGELTLATGHPLYPNLKAIIAVENDGTVREYVSAVTGSGATTATGAGGEVGSSTAMSANMGAQIAAFASAEYSGNGGYSLVWYGDMSTNLAAAQDPMVKIGSASGMASNGAYGQRLLRRAVGPTSLALDIYGMWSGGGPASSSPLLTASGASAVVLALMTTITGGAWANQAYNGTSKSSAGTASLHATNDSNNGSTTWIAAAPLTWSSGTPVVYWAAVFDRELTEGELDGLAADPWSLFGAAVPMPSISSVTGSVIPGGSVTINGSNLDLVTAVYLDSGAPLSRTQAQTIGTQSASAITLTLNAGTLPWTSAAHAGHQIRVTDGTNEDTAAVTLTVPAGWSLVTTSGTQLEDGDGTSLHDWIPGAAAAGEQFAWQVTTDGDANTDTWAVTVTADGAFLVTGGAGHDTFDVQHWDSTNGRGAVATVNLYDSVADFPASAIGSARMPALALAFEMTV